MTNDRTARLPKWAQSYIAELEQAKREADAFKDLGTAEPERMPLPQCDREHPLPGWDYNEYTSKVVHCWTANYVNWFGQIDPPGRYTSGSKGGRRLFATRLDALRGLRAAKVREYQKVLADIDAQIDKEQKTP